MLSKRAGASAFEVNGGYAVNVPDPNSVVTAD
jgi:hypothetical protein